MSTVHTVKSGDTLWAIAQRNDVTVKQLVDANPQLRNPDLIVPGQRLTIPDHRDDRATPQAPQVAKPAAAGIGHDAPEVAATAYTVRGGDTMSRIAEQHDIPLLALIAANPQIRNPSLIHPGDVLLIPGGAPSRPATPAPAQPVAPVVNGQATGAELEAFPVAGGQFNIGWDQAWDDFGHQAQQNTDYYKHSEGTHTSGHHGNDIFGPRGAPIVAPVSGTIVSLSYDDTGAGGRRITIERDGHRFYLAHLDALAPGLKVGDSIDAGVLVGALGDSGNAKGSAPHLHFSIYKGTDYYDSVDPFPFLQEALAHPAVA
jgi:spore coat assembly protein SafA